MHDDLAPTFHRQKFKDVVHFVCANCRKEELGNVKLHKILYFSDMLAYLSTGNPLTGVEYRKQQFGPVARHLTWALKQLADEGRISIENRNYYGFEKKDYVSLRSPSRELLGNQEVVLLLDVIDFVCARSAREISELSHDQAWHAVRMGEVIPYFAAFGLFPTEISDEDMRASIDEARRIRPVIDADRFAG